MILRKVLVKNRVVGRVGGLVGTECVRIINGNATAAGRHTDGHRWFGSSARHWAGPCKSLVSNW